MALMARFFPVHRSGLSLYDQFFGHELRRMEAELDRMRRQMFQLMPCEHHCFGDDGGMLTDADDMKPPVHIVTDDKGQRKIQMQFDVKDYKPDEVKVRMLDNNVLQVRAEHEEKGEGELRKRLYVRQYTLPRDVDTQQLKPVLSSDGVLTIEAVASPALQSSERLIPVEYKQSEEPKAAK